MTVKTAHYEICAGTLSPNGALPTWSTIKLYSLLLSSICKLYMYIAYHNQQKSFFVVDLTEEKVHFDQPAHSINLIRVFSGPIEALDP